MDDFEKAIQALQQIEKIFGLIGVVIVLTLIIMGYLLFRFINKSIEKIAEEASQKSLAKFQSNLDEKVDTRMKLFFRNEDIRNTITSHYAIKSIDVKLEVWTETYKLYFDYQKTWHYSKEELDALIEEFDKKFQTNREKIFINSVYLGGFMTTKLITLNSSLREAIRKQYLYNHLVFPHKDGPRVEKEKRFYLDKIDAILPEVEKWITSNLTVDHNSKMWDFTPDQMKIIEEQNKQKFEEVKDIKTDLQVK